MEAVLFATSEPFLATLGFIDFAALDSAYLWCALIIAVVLLLWDTIEVGRNDAANLINAVFGARILAMRTAVLIAGVGVILGAASSSPVMETARKGIFDPGQLTVEQALAVYVSVYIVDTALLYGYSVFGMPVSTTACLVFELLGAAFAVGGFSVVHWDKAGKVVFAIVCSIVISGIAAFFIQRIVRGAIRDRSQNLSVLLAHGGWVGGLMLSGLTYFMLVKGMKHVAFVKSFNSWLDDIGWLSEFQPIIVVGVLAVGFMVLIHALLLIFGKRAAKLLFPTLAVIGTLAMAFAFGQNDLANCASPGLASLSLLGNLDKDVASASEVPISTWALVGCGVLMAFGITSKGAHRVTSAAVHAGSMAHTVRLWAPGWCVAIARTLLRFRGREPALAPSPALTVGGKTMHYDALRACVILGVSASVIATASGFGMPVSTTYVSFAAIIASGMGDRILQRGDADLKLARTIWVIFSWFSAAVIAAVCAGVVCLAVYHLGVVGMGACLLTNFGTRWFLKRRGDAQEKRVREAARERRHPEFFAEAED